jgi:Dolichyl-phosphate-mannose-protein mannosyltransferase
MAVAAWRREVVKEMNMSQSNPVRTSAQALWERFDRFAARLEQRPWLVLSSCLLLFLLLSAPIAATRAFWFDELFTVWISSLPSLGHIWDALSRGVDLQPPLLAVLTRAARAVFGGSELATRLPALAGFGLMTVCLFWFVCRRTNALWGALAALTPMVTGAHWFCCEARPYGLVLGFSSLALLCWQVSAEARWRRLALVGLWLSLALTLSSHYYGILVLVPLLVGEAARTLERRAMDWPVILGILLAVPAIFPYLPLIRAGAALQSLNPWNPPNPGFLYSSFTMILETAAIPLGVSFVVLFLAAFTPKDMPVPGRGLAFPEVVACFGFLLIPIPALAIAYLGVNMVHARYVLPIVIGFSVVFACGIERAVGRTAGVAMLFVLGMVGCFFVQSLPVVRHLRNPASQFRDAIIPKGARFDALPLVFGSAGQYFQYRYYGSREVRSRSLYVAEPRLALHYLGTDVVDTNLIAAQPFFSLSLTSWEELRRTRPSFLLISRRGGFVDSLDWVSRHVQEECAPTTLVSMKGDTLLLHVDCSGHRP